MPKTKEELMMELFETQNFIDACVTARTFKLGLDEATYEKYNNAVERQKELVEILDAMEDQRLSIRTVAQFRRKEPVLQQDECEIDKVVELSRDEFHSFKNNLLDDYDFISENKDFMYIDKMGTIHCLLVLGDDYDEGILVNSEGSSYARYSALLPNARSFIEQQMGQESKMTLWQLMSCGLEDVHLVDTDEEHDLATIVELNQGTLSVAGRSAWSDVLSAKVEGIFEGCYGTQIAVSGCDPQRLADFSFMLAGHCDAEDYDTWVNKHDQEQDIGPVLSM